MATPGAGEFFIGSKGQLQRVPRLEQNQVGAQNTALQLALQQLQNPTEGFQPIADKARTRFTTQTLPSIAERFTAMGSGGSQRSGAFRNALFQGGSSLEEALAALESQYGLQQQSLASNLLSQGLQPQNENIYFKGQQGLVQNTIPGLLKILLALFGGGL